MSDTPDLSLEAALSPQLTQASQPYIGEWNQLVSTTNWEKGRIIAAWRGSLIDAEASPAEYADEAWGRLVGGVTGQHVGRLRRVYQRFGQVYTQYRSLYWSHFQAAIDWEDAEMWLEGAVQSEWSVSQMRKQRWETLGAVAADEPRAEDAIASELDEDFEPAQEQSPIPTELKAQYGEIPSGPLHEGPDFGEEGQGGYAPADDAEASASAGEPLEAAQAVDRVRPFEALADLPEEVLEAIERFKLLILKHRREGWQELTQSDMVGALEALKQLALAPADEAAPF
jgi:hypothetical protein